MSMLPNIVGPVLQSPQQAQNVSQIQDNERAQQANAGRAQARAIEAADGSVSTTDVDSQVDSDAAGAGSQGRAFQSESQEDLLEGDAPESVTLDDDGNPHLDIQA
jgi:hypothetical protein